MPHNLLPSKPLNSTLTESRPRFTAGNKTTTANQHYANQITLGKPGTCPLEPEEKKLVAQVDEDQRGPVRPERVDVTGAVGAVPRVLDQPVPASEAGRLRRSLARPLLMVAMLVAGGLALVEHPGRQSALPASAPGAPHLPASPSLGATLPILGKGTRPVRPLRLLLVVPKRAVAALRPQLADLSVWIRRNEQPESTIRVLETGGRAARLSVPRTGGWIPGLDTATPEPKRQAVRWLLSHTRVQAIRISISIGTQVAYRQLVGNRTVRAGTITLSDGAPVPSSTSADLKRRDSVAAASALQILEASNQLLSAAPRPTTKP